MPHHSYWFTKWLIALGLFLPFWGFLSLENYTPEQSLLWNISNYKIVVGFLPKENILACWNYDVGTVINTAFGFRRDTMPPGCLERAAWSYPPILAISIFMLVMGAYFFFFPPKVDEYKIAYEEKKPPARKPVRTKTLDGELATQVAEIPVHIERKRRVDAIPEEALPSEGDDDGSGTPPALPPTVTPPRTTPQED